MERKRSHRSRQPPTHGYGERPGRPGPRGGYVANAWAAQKVRRIERGRTHRIFLASRKDDHGRLRGARGIRPRLGDDKALTHKIERSMENSRTQRRSRFVSKSAGGETEYLTR